MRIILFIIGLLPGVISYSQNHSYNIVYKLRYENQVLMAVSKKVKSPIGFSSLVFNDSMAYWYWMKDNKDPMKNNKAYGSKVLYHALLCNKNSRIFYNAMPETSGHPTCYIPDSIRLKEWSFSEDTKQILGYECKKAYWVNEYLKDSASVKIWQSDSTIVWYAEKIKVPFGPFEYFGLPGLILEVLDWNRLGVHFTAINLEPDIFTIAIPPNIPVLTGAEYNKWKR